MAAVMIGVDPHKALHTAVVISSAEEPLGELRVRRQHVESPEANGPRQPTAQDSQCLRQLQAAHGATAAATRFGARSIPRAPTQSHNNPDLPLAVRIV